MGIRPQETRLVEAVARLFRRMGFQEIKTEVQFCERFLDIVARMRPTGGLVAVEAKVNSPSRAFRQAARYFHVAQRVYVAQFAKSPTSLAIDLAKSTGIGLIVVKADRLGRLAAAIHIEGRPSNLFDRKLASRIWDLAATDSRMNN